MDTAENPPAIRHDGARHRFAVDVDGHEGFVEYAREGDVLVITHTVVPPEIGGRGIAGQLVKAALEHARAAGLRVRPDCSYAAGYLQRHGEYADLLAPR